MTDKGKEYLLKAKELILARPEHLYMNDWLKGEINEDIDTVRRELRKGNKDPYQCNTTACIAGWVAMFAVTDGRRQRKNSWGESEEIDDFSLRMLGDHSSDSLFYVSYWPDDLMHRYSENYDEEDYDEAAKVAAEAIDRFIAGDGSFNTEEDE